MYLVRLDTFSKVSNEFYGGRRLAIERYYYGLRDTIWKEKIYYLKFYLYFISISNLRIFIKFGYIRRRSRLE